MPYVHGGWCLNMLQLDLSKNLSRDDNGWDQNGNKDRGD